MQLVLYLTSHCFLIALTFHLLPAFIFIMHPCVPFIYLVKILWRTSMQPHINYAAKHPVRPRHWLRAHHSQLGTRSQYYPLPDHLIHLIYSRCLSDCSWVYDGIGQCKELHIHVGCVARQWNICPEPICSLPFVKYVPFRNLTMSASTDLIPCAMPNPTIYIASFFDKLAVISATNLIRYLYRVFGWPCGKILWNNELVWGRNSDTSIITLRPSLALVNYTHTSCWSQHNTIDPTDTRRSDYVDFMGGCIYEMVSAVPGGP